MADEKDNVVDIGCITVLDIPAEKILDAAKLAGLKHVIVIGEYEDGDEYFASSTSDRPLANWMIDRTKLEILEDAGEEEDDEDDLT